MVRWMAVRRDEFDERLRFASDGEILMATREVYMSLHSRGRLP